MTNKERAARALDYSLYAAGRNIGIQTDKYRNALAEWLDGARKLKSSSVRIMCIYLEKCRQV